VTDAQRGYEAALRSVSAAQRDVQSAVRAVASAQADYQRSLTSVTGAQKDYQRSLADEKRAQEEAERKAKERHDQLVKDAQARAEQAIRDGFELDGLRVPVCPGDETDLRFLDPAGHVVALYAKGNAKKKVTAVKPVCPKGYKKIADPFGR